MLERHVCLSAPLRVVVIVLSALGLLGLGIVVAMGALRSEGARRSEDAPAGPAMADIPPMDRQVPGRIETATFAMG